MGGPLLELCPVEIPRGDCLISLWVARSHTAERHRVRGAVAVGFTVCPSGQSVG